MLILKIPHIMGEEMRRKDGSSATVSTTNRISSVLGKKPGLLDKEPGTNMFGSGTVEKLNLKHIHLYLCSKLFASAQIRKKVGCWDR
jgi:hypothetical protein